MADNKRITQLVTNPDPVGKLFLMDALGLPQALAITFSDLEKAISPVVYRVLVPDDPSAAAANTAAIAAALADYAQSGNRKGVMRLPRGTFWINESVVIAAAHSGLTIDADGCTLMSNVVTPPFPKNIVMSIGAATGTDPAGYQEGFEFDPMFPKRLTFSMDNPLDPNYRVDDAIQLFVADNNSLIRQPVQQTSVIKSLDPALRQVFIDDPVIQGLQNDSRRSAKWLYNGRKLSNAAIPAGTIKLQLPESQATEFNKDTWIYITDGVAVLELYGEYVRVVDKQPVPGGLTELTLETGTTNSYIPGRVAIIPAGKWVENVTIRGLTLGGAHLDVMHPEQNQLLAKYCVNLRFERMRSERAYPTLVNAGSIVSTSHEIDIVDSTFPNDKGLEFSSCRNARVQRSRIIAVTAEFCSEITYRDCEILKRYTHDVGSARIHADHCQFYDIASFGIGNDQLLGADCSLTHCDVFAALPSFYFYVRANRCRFEGVRAITGSLTIDIVKGTGHLIQDIGGNVVLESGTGGTLMAPVTGAISVPSNILFPTDWVIIRAFQVGRALPTNSSSSNTIEVGTISGTSLGTTALWANVSVSVHADGIGLTKLYQIVRAYDLSGIWYRCLPLSDSGPYVGNDIDLDLQEMGSDFKLRLRRKAGTTPATAVVRIETNGEFMSSPVVDTATAPALVHPSTAVSQRKGQLFGPGAGGFDGPVDFGTGLTANVLNAANPLRLSQTFFGSGYSAAGFQPVGGNIKCYLGIFPSGSEQEAALEILNNADRANAGFLRLGVMGTEGRLDTYQDGTGQALQVLIVGVGIKFTGKMQLPTTPPTTGDLDTGGCYMWFDPATPPAVKFQAKIGGATKNGLVPLV